MQLRYSICFIALTGSLIAACTDAAPAAPTTAPSLGAVPANPFLDYVYGPTLDSVPGWADVTITLDVSTLPAACREAITKAFSAKPSATERADADASFQCLVTGQPAVAKALSPVGETTRR